MRFENTEIETLKVEFNALEEVMKKHRMIREGQWDYERVSYDHKFQVREGTYYLRIQGYPTEGDIGSRKATIQLLTPILGKYYYPHGVEYGEDENFPKHLVEKCNKKLKDMKEDLAAIAL